MTTPEQQNNNQEELAPIIPSSVLLGIAGVAFLVFLTSLALAFDSVVQLGAGAITLILLLVWVFMFPEEFLNFLKGRSFRFGAVGVLVVVLIFVAAGFAYAIVQRASLSYDFSERNIYSLDDDVRDVLTQLGNDVTVPPVYILGFYTLPQANQRDLDEVLLNDMVAASGGKIVGYRFVDPNVEPLLTQGYLGGDSTTGTPRTPAFVVATLDEAGNPSTTNFEQATIGFDQSLQFPLVNSMLNLVSTGDFRAYFLDLEGSVDIEATGNLGGSGFKGDLEDADWIVEAVNPLAITGDSPSVLLNNPATNAEVVFLAGGTAPLPEEVITALQSYSAQGGDLIVMGDINPEGTATAAQAENFSNFLWENYGVRFRNDLVFDTNRGFRTALGLYVDEFEAHPITSGLRAGSAVLFEAPHSIEISDTPPTGVTITILLTTSDAGYAKSNLDFTSLTEEDIVQAEGDLTGEIPLAVAVENTTTGSRLVLISSDILIYNADRSVSGVVSPDFVQESVIWASNATNFASTVRRLVPEANPADTPAIVTEDKTRWMGFVSLGILPFGMLALGVLVWWLQRPRHN